MHFNIHNTIGFLNNLILSQFNRVRAEDYLRGAIDEVDYNIRLLKSSKDELTGMFADINDLVKQAKTKIKEETFADADERLMLIETFTDAFKTYMKETYITLRQKMLLIHYLGLLETLNNNVGDNASKQGRIISLLFDSSEKNTIDMVRLGNALSRSNDPKKGRELLKDLTACKLILEREGLIELANLIEKDIDKMERKL